MDATTPPAVVAAGSVIMGFGMGFLSTAAIVIIQSSVEWPERGSATASNIFARNLGSTLGATALGAVFNISLARGGGGAAAASFDDIRRLLENPLAMIGNAAARSALGHSLHLTFYGIFIISVLTLLVATLVPPIRSTAAPVTTPDAA